jgi:hypothetical protein
MKLGSLIFVLRGNDIILDVLNDHDDDDNDIITLGGD